MANNVTTTGGGSLTEVPNLSPELRRIIDRTETIANYGTDEGPPADGAILHAGNWVKPGFVPETLRAEANRQLPVFQAVARNCSTQTFLRWLNVLWTCCAKPAGSTETWEAVKLAYPVMMDDFPAACFTKHTLLAARDHFKFFPSCNELAEFLAPYRNSIMNNVFRLHAIANAPTKPTKPEPEPWKPTSPEERAKVAAICAELRARPATPFKASLRPEDDPKKPDVIDDEDAARRNPKIAQFREETRRIHMARAEAARHGNENDWARFHVPIDQALAGDLRQHYGHACPGYDPAAPAVKPAMPPEPMPKYWKDPKPPAPGYDARIRQPHDMPEAAP